MGHITAEELLRHMDETDYANGFANRFLWCFVRRSKHLPEGGSLTNEKIVALADRLTGIRQRAAQIFRLRRDAQASQLWQDVYVPLTEERLGLVGAVTSRSEAQVLRLSCLYALLDCSETITVEHLEAALAVWSYCDASCRHIFAAKSGDPVAERILQALRRQPEGLTRTEISALFQGHRSAAEIDRALRQLAGQGLAFPFRVKTGGRPKEVWKAACCSPPNSPTTREGEPEQ